MSKKKYLTGMEWLRDRMDKLEYFSLQEVAEDVGINRGNLYRYFTLETKPSIAMMPPLCEVLHATWEELLVALEVIKPVR